MDVRIDAYLLYFLAKQSKRLESFCFFFHSIDTVPRANIGFGVDSTRPGAFSSEGAFQVAIMVIPRRETIRTVGWIDRWPRIVYSIFIQS